MAEGLTDNTKWQLSTLNLNFLQDNKSNVQVLSPAEEDKQ